LRINHESKDRTQTTTTLRNDAMSPLFMAVIEATEEAIINSLFAAETMKGKEGHIIRALPKEEVIKILKKHQSIK
jgi:D-aminopeptidase